MVTEKERRIYMFIDIEEMKSVLYKYQMDEIAENDDSIIQEAILAAIAEVRAYLEAANARRETANLTQQQYANWKLYDTDAIFNATGDDRNDFLVRLVKRVAVYNICELSNVDIIYDHVQQRYEGTIGTLEKIAGIGQYANSRIIINELPSPATPPTNDENQNTKPFRMVSRVKFNHE